MKNAMTDAYMGTSEKQYRKLLLPESSPKNYGMNIAGKRKNKRKGIRK